MSKRRIGSGPGPSKRTQIPKFRFSPKLRQLVKRFPQLAQEFLYSWNLVKLLIAFEFVINYLIINKVKYTEIDWSTYMVQLKQIFNWSSPNFNYTQIEGPTGPLVYPAGHSIIFYLLKLLTEDGNNIQAAQYIYMLIYIAQIYLVYKIYSHKRVFKVPPYMFIIMTLTSYRIHSIYVLRLFNDPIAILVAYGSFYSMLKKKYLLSSILFSLAVSIKMNVLLFAPGFALIFYEELGLCKSIKYASISLATQLLLAAPYLYVNPLGYLQRAFDFNRVFLHKWTVNWRFIDEKTFVSTQFFKILLALHLLILFAMFWSRWINIILPKRFSINARREDPMLTLFITNFIGVAFSRSLHYQFYVWYYHSLPMLVWATKFRIVTRLLILGCIEYAWNEYPSTNFSSALLHASHLAILIGLFKRHFKTNHNANVNGKMIYKKKTSQIQ